MTTLIAIGLFVYLIYSNRSLASRLGALESKLNNTAGVGMTNAESNMAEPSVMNPVVASYTAPESLEAPNRFTTWLKEDWLMKLGAALFIVGFGWFVSYAFANNWIGSVGRISIGIVAGIIIMALGFRRMMKHPSQGAVFMALGAGMAMLTIFAGRSIYGFFTPVTAVLFDFLIAAFVSFASYKFNLKALAVVAQILAFLAPLLTAGTTDSVFLFSYLFFISLATLFLASVTGWRDLIVASLIFVGMYSVPYIGHGFSDSMYAKDAPIILNFAYLFSLLYLASGMFAVIKKGVESSKNEIVLAVLNGLFLFMWIYGVASKEWSSTIFAVWAMIFVVSSFVAFKFSSKLAPFFAYGSVAVAFIAAATAAELNGATLTIAFTIEVLILVLSVLLLTNKVKAAVRTSWLFFYPIMLSFSSMSKYSYSQELFSEDFFVLALIAVSLIVTGRIITYYLSKAKETQEAKAGSVLVIIGTFFIGYTLWYFIHIFLRQDPDIATMAALILFTIFGLIAYFSGLYGNDMARRAYGIALLAFVVGRLVFVDVWDMELFGRVVTFLAIGVLLMSTAFLTKKKKQELAHV